MMLMSNLTSPEKNEMRNIDVNSFMVTIYGPRQDKTCLHGF